MKNLTQLIFAGIIGGAVAFGAFKFFDRDIVIYEQVAMVTEVSDTGLKSSSIESFYTDFVIAADKANPAVVHISAQNKAYVKYNRRSEYDPFSDFFFFRRNQDRPQAGTGSGVIISENGYIVTNNHVVGFADFMEVTLENGKTYAAKKIGADPSTDLAVIKIEAQALPTLKFADSDHVKVGEWVAAVGNPFNLMSTVTAGIVSAKGRDIDIIRGQKTIEEFIQTDAVVNPGNSGGALVNTLGELIGINTAISSPTGVYAGYSFAIPSNLVRRVVDEIIEVGGDIQRALLGIYPIDIDEVKKQGVDVSIDYGAYVREFSTDRYGRREFSSAEHSGIELGDIITKLNGKRVTNTNDLREALKFAKMGDIIKVTINRNGKTKTISVKLRQGI